MASKKLLEELENKSKNGTFYNYKEILKNNFSTKNLKSISKEEMLKN